MKNVLVTGAAGFIGSNFVHYLLAHSSESSLRVISLDSLDYAGREANLDDLKDDPRHTFIRGNICNSELLSYLYSSYDFDTVINFAAHTHVDRSIADPKPFTVNNVLGTQSLLEISRRYWQHDPDAFDHKRFIQISTDEVYGALGPDDPAFTELTPLNPTSPYSASKASADLTALAYHKTFGLPIVVTRCSNNYGPRQYPEKLIPHMISQALHDKPLPVYGDGKQVRDWLHVEDHCSAVLAAIERGRLGEIYNIGGENEHTNLEIVETILDTLGKPRSLISHVTDRLAHDRRYAINPAKTHSELGWSPAHDFTDGLRSTVEWYLSHQAFCADCAAS